MPSSNGSSNGNMLSDVDCHLCRKRFDRKELRDRHTRRCIKTFGKPRPSKQKSCISCARSKLKCNLATPACQRCLDRGISCEYSPKFRSPTASSSVNCNKVDVQPPSAVPVATNITHGNENIQFTPPGQANALDSGADSVPTKPNSGSYAGSSTSGATGENQVPLIAEQPNGGKYDDALLDPSGSGLSLVDMNMYLWFNGVEQNPLLESFDMDDFLQEQDSLLDMQLSPFPNVTETVDAHASKPGPPGNCTLGAYATGTELHFDGSNLGNSDAELTTLPTDTPNMLAPYEPTVTALPTRPETPKGQDFTGIDQHPSLDKVVSELPPSPTPQDLIQFTCSYPRKMLDKDYWPPFVHTNLYRCSQGGVCEPLAIALCCVSAKYNEFANGDKFVGEILHLQRERLVNEFHSFSSVEDAFAAVHALCLYQITGLLDGNVQKAQPKISSAQLHQSFLLKITRRLCREQKHLLEHFDKSNWEAWKLGETLRRTVHLVNIINILCCHSQPLCARYYEPLDDELILDLPLPCPESFWKACTHERWDAVRTAEPDTTLVTPRMALCDNASIETGLGLGQSVGSVVDESKELTKLILASIRLQSSKLPN